mgnify:CR=1 FL=1
MNLIFYHVQKVCNGCLKTEISRNLKIMSIGKLKSKEIQSTAHAPLDRVIQSTNFDYKPQFGVENIQAAAYNGSHTVWKKV